jgi:hypothetical protein
MNHLHLYLITQDACAAANVFMRVSELMEAFFCTGSEENAANVHLHPTT